MTVKIAAFVMIQIYATKNVKLTEKIFSKFMTLLQKITLESSCHFTKKNTVVVPGVVVMKRRRITLDAKNNTLAVAIMI